MIRALSRRLSKGASDDAGLSLTELLVAMMISSMVLVMVGAMFINVAEVTTNSNATTTRSSDAANIMDEVSRVIRTASNNAVSTSVQSDPAIVSATATALTLYSYIDASPANPAPTKVTFRFDAQNRMVEDRVAATVSANYWVFTGTATTRTLGGPVTTAGTFTYLDSTGAVLPIATGGLTLAQRALVASVRAGPGVAFVAVVQI